MTRLSETLNAANSAALSARSIARAAQARGFTLNHDTAARYLRGDHGRPDETTLRALAAVLSIPLQELRAAADLPAEEIEPYQPPAEASRLNRRQRRAVDEIIRAMLDNADQRVTDLDQRRAASGGGEAGTDFARPAGGEAAARRGAVEARTDPH